MLKLCYVFLLVASVAILMTAPVLGNVTVSVLAGFASLFSVAGILTSD